MVKRNNEHKFDTMQSMFGGAGQVEYKRIIETPEELYGKGRLFSVVTLQKGCEIGYHVHKGDGEFFYILSGEGEYNDNGTVCTVTAGDSTFTDEGEGHSMINRKDEPLVFVGLVVYK